MNDSCSSLPVITTSLLSKGKNTIGHETNLARTPIWHARPRGTAEDTVVSLFLFGHPFRKVEGRNLTTTDQRLFAHLTTSYVRAGCPDSRQVPFSLSEASALLGYETVGGRQRALVRSSLGRLRSVTFESALRHPDGHETVVGWGLIDGYLVTTRGGGKGWVKISEPVAHLLREGSVTYLHAPTWDAIRTEDEVAGRLWSFLESERIGKGWRYPLLSSEDPTRRPSPMTLAIADVLQLNWASRPRRIAQRVREACDVVERHDRRYHLRLMAGHTRGSWVLTCSRSQAAPTPTTEMPETVIRAWREAHHSRLPSIKQRAILIELLTRRSTSWIVEHLQRGTQTENAFGYLLAADREQSASALAAARHVEDEWERTKQQESSTGEQSLMELLGSVQRHLQLASDSDQ
jgi:hypothetical protein